MMFKSRKLKELFEKLFANYKDGNGRYCYQESSKSDASQFKYDSLNQHLWTGEAHMLLSYCTSSTAESLIFRNEERSQLKQILNQCSSIHKKNFFGLISRHPWPYQVGNQFDPISLDEYFGIHLSFLALTLPIESYQTLQYARSVDWFISDYPGHIRDTPWKKVLSKDFFTTLFKVVKHLIKTKDLTGSNELDEILYPSNAFKHLTRWWMPKDRLWFYLGSGEKAPWICWEHFKLAAKNTLKVSNNELSGKILLFFKILYLQKYLELGGKDERARCVFKIAKEFNQELTIKYGVNYLSVIFGRYFEDSSHPFILIAREFSFHPEHWTFDVRPDTESKNHTA